MNAKLTKKEITKAVARYARKHGYSADTVRFCTTLWSEAIREYREAHADQPATQPKPCRCRPAKQHRDCAYCGSGWDDGRVCGVCREAGIDGHTIRGTGRVVCEAHCNRNAATS